MGKWFGYANNRIKSRHIVSVSVGSVRCIIVIFMKIIDW